MRQAFPLESGTLPYTRTSVWFLVAASVGIFRTSFTRLELRMAKLKLSAKYQAKVDRSYRYEGGHKTFLAHYGSLRDEHLPAIIDNSRGMYDHLSEDRRTADVIAGLIRGLPLLVRGHAIRLTEDSPQDLAYSSSLYARLECWGCVLDEYNEFLHHAWSLLPAMAAGDFQFTLRYAEEMPQSATSGPMDFRLIHNGVVAVLLRNDELLENALSNFREWKKPNTHSNLT